MIIAGSMTYYVRYFIYHFLSSAFDARDDQQLSRWRTTWEPDRQMARRLKHLIIETGTLTGEISSFFLATEDIFQIY